ncbi:uncharacterized protein LOC126753564 isoform X3 [Bactrocera neohumeralis]|uniref:uncharacterized protein LOC120769779 isoform X1 n=1 Tax=Bactrocera tryoni TaxID=59916 RepID=UPI001A973187|nr:uncharacterized protein LOC120769779 isoform X1 [Bactrocera tryoni]XP_050321061.1 uncharacterized protein LOC126753564 isoform X3 [Bactrocera neohumeralis]
MAVVLFIITIPTETEELLLQSEFRKKKPDIGANYGREDKLLSTPVTTATTTATLSNLSNATTTTAAVTINITDANEIDIVSLGAKMDNPLTTQTLDQQQYSTFPKRRRSEGNKFLFGDAGQLLKNSIFRDSSTGSASDSAKDIDVEIVDGPPFIRKSWEGLRDILSSSSRKRKRDSSQLNIPNDSCMETVLREILKRSQIFNAVWTKDTDGRMHQVIFTVEFNENYENLLDKLHEWGIGDRVGSSVSVMNCLVSKTFRREAELDLPQENDDVNLNEQKQSVWNRFMNSVRSRLNVAQIVRDVRQDAAITFDFVILLISATILAAIGLAEDSTIFLAASMLVSPLMGPIIAAIFGTAIKDPTLRTLGLRNELIGILIATIIGFIFGLVICSIDERYGNGEGLTAEMLSRSELHSLLVGLFTAIPSGAAAAVAILGGNIGSLVGVAISASLLPPAINAGVLWALALIYTLFETDDSRFNIVVKSHSFSNNQATELVMLGAISMLVTISNIICVYIMGVLVLKVKEIAPAISRNHREFWKHDIKIARGLPKNGIDTNALIDEFANLPREDQKTLGIDYDLLRTLRLDDASYQNTWSPISNRQLFDRSALNVIRDNYSTVHQIERLYSTMNQQQTLQYGRNRCSLNRHPTARASDYGNTYEILAASVLPRCATMPTQTNCPSINVLNAVGEADSSTANPSTQSSMTNTPTATLDERKRRKFIVTPAEDPIRISINYDEMDA